MNENTKLPAVRGAWQTEKVLMKKSSKRQRGTKASNFAGALSGDISTPKTYKSLLFLVRNNQHVAKDTPLGRTSEWSSLVNLILPYFQFIKLNTVE